MSLSEILQKNCPHVVNHPKTFFFILTLLAGLAIFWPQLDFQYFLAQGDHGYNLYAFQQTAHGAVPGKDYAWNYGPLMPYYYGLSLNLLGNNIHSVICAEMLLVFVSGILFFFSLSFFLSPFLAFIGAVWFWAFRPDFFYTYNHTGGVTLLLAITYFLFAYLKTSRTKNIVGALAAAFVLVLVRPNMGIAAFAGILFSFLIIDLVLDKKKVALHKMYFFSAILIFPIFLFLVYWWLGKNMPAHTTDQTLLPFLAEIQTVLQKFPLFLMAFSKYLAWFFPYVASSSLPSFLVFMLILVLTGRFFFLLSTGRFDPKQKQTALLSLAITLIFFFVSIHEYYVDLVPYRINWSIPFFIIFSFLGLGFGMTGIKKTLAVVIPLIILLIPAQQIFKQCQFIDARRNPQHYLALPQGKIYCGNQPQWVSTVEQTTAFLNRHLAKDETFLALPYEPIYYFLTGRKSLTWQVLLIKTKDNGKDPLEKEIIDQLEKDKVRYIVLSNRLRPAEKDYGVLGKDYFVELYKYILANYKPVAAYGPWNKPGAWIYDHAVMVLKRTE